MRLLNSSTLEFEIFNDESLPEYLILSHTWGDEEVSYQDMRYLQKLAILPVSLRQDTAALFSLSLSTGTSYVSREDIESKAGYRKVTSTARMALERDYRFFWIDTCCIDKTSSSELQEAINSMYRWYEEAAICIAFLDDVYPGVVRNLSDFHFGELLAGTRWITRGWTLQELIAPREVHFVNAGWAYMTSKSISSQYLSSVTGIPRHVLETGDLSKTSVAQKMSWAADRMTTRAEDRAYSLLGIFGVHMPMLYGEGANAFTRLQEEILKTTPDDSIFYWIDGEDSNATCRGLLAPSPNAFKVCGNVCAGPPVLISNTNLGISLRLKARPLKDTRDLISVGLLNAHDHGASCAITLRILRVDQYGTSCARVKPNLVSPDTFTNTKEYMTIYVSHQPQVPPNIFSTDAHCFRFRFMHKPNRLKIGRMWPASLQDEHGRMLILPSPNKDFISLSQIMVQYKNGPGTEICKLIIGLNRATSKVWCRLVKDDAEFPDFASATSKAWGKYIERVYGKLENHSRASSLALLDASSVPSLAVPLRWVSVKIETGISRDKICYFMEVSEVPHDFVYV